MCSWLAFTLRTKANDLKIRIFFMLLLSSEFLSAQDFSEGNTLLQAKRYVEAQAYFEELIINEWANSHFHYGAGLACYFQRNYEQANIYFENAIDIDPTLSPFFYYKANTLYAQRRYTQAIKYYEKALEINEASIERISQANGMHYLGLCYLKLKEYQNSVTVFGEVIALDSGYIKAYINRGIAKGYLGKIKDACQDFKAAYVLGDESASEYILKYCPATSEELNLSR